MSEFVLWASIFRNAYFCNIVNALTFFWQLNPWHTYFVAIRILPIHACEVYIIRFFSKVFFDFFYFCERWYSSDHDSQYYFSANSKSSILALNRQEFFNSPSVVAHFWVYFGSVFSVYTLFYFNALYADDFFFGCASLLVLLMGFSPFFLLLVWTI